MKRMTIMASCLVFGGALLSQDMSAGAATDPAALLAAQADAAAKLLPGTPAEVGGVKTAEDAVKANLAKLGIVNPGYDRKRHAIIAIGTAEVLIKDPANDKSFMLVRSAKANEAYLNAKADIIQALYTEVSAVDRLSVVGEFGEEAPTDDYKKKCEALEEKRVALVKKLEALDKAKASTFAGATLGDRLLAALEIISRDSSIGSGLKAECAALKAECRELERQAEKLSPPVPSTESESSVKLLSKMPLLGSSVITQAESWDETEQVYSISIAIVWSTKMQESAIALMSNEVVPSMSRGRFTPQEWAARQNFATMIGPRRFTDSEGNNIFVGIAAVDMTGPVRSRGAKRKLADAAARRFVAFSLAGDVETFTEAAGNYKEYDDDKRTAMEKLANRTSQKCDTVLQGCTQLATQIVKHPITGRTIYVSAYYVDPMLAKDASVFLKKSFSGALRQAEVVKKMRVR